MVTVFDSTQMEWVQGNFTFDVLWLSGALFWTFLTREVKLFVIIGLIFILVGTSELYLSIKHYREDIRALESGNVKTVMGSVDYFNDSGSRQTFFGVQGKRFRCHSYSGNIKPSKKFCEPFKVGIKLKVTYVVNGERGDKRGHRIIKIVRF